VRALNGFFDKLPQAERFIACGARELSAISRIIDAHSTAREEGALADVSCRGPLEITTLLPPLSPALN